MVSQLARVSTAATIIIAVACQAHTAPPGRGNTIVLYIGHGVLFLAFLVMALPSFARGDFNYETTVGSNYGISPGCGRYCARPPACL